MTTTTPIAKPVCTCAINALFRNHAVDMPCGLLTADLTKRYWLVWRCAKRGIYRIRGSYQTMAAAHRNLAKHGWPYEIVENPTPFVPTAR